MEQTHSTKLFENILLERLTHVHHNTPLFIFSPVILASLFASLFARHLGEWTTAACFLWGVLNWSLFEYLLHRFVFHYEPTSGFGKKMAYLFHGIHHAFPNEADRLVMPPVTSIPLAAAVFGVHYTLAGSKGFPLFAGFLAGYLYYEFVHYSVHHKKRPSALWKEPQRKNHLLHHFKEPEGRFGVTSPLWDFVFRTYR